MNKKLVKGLLLSLGLISSGAITFSISTAINSNKTSQIHEIEKMHNNLQNRTLVKNYDSSNANYSLQEQFLSSNNQSSQFNKFPIFKKTTTISNGTLKGVNSIKIKDIQDNDLQVIQALIDSGLIKNLAPNQTLAPSDVEFTIVNKNALNGSIKVNITIKNSKAINGGKAKPEMLFENVDLSGFNSVFGDKDTTTTISNGTLPGVENIIPLTVTDNDPQIIQALIDSGLIKNLVPNQTLTIDDIQYIVNNKDLTEGLIEADITIKNSKAMENNTPIPEVTFYGVVLDGFIKAPENEQTTIVSGGELKGFNTIYANNIINNDNLLIEALINDSFIKYTIPNQKLSPSDIELKINSLDIVNGTINVNITIKNGLGWENGQVVQDMLFSNIEYTGFKKEPNIKPTTIDNPAKIIISNENQIKASLVPNNDPELIQAIINSGVIHDIAPGEELEVSDIKYAIINNSRIGKQGEVTINLTIMNNKTINEQKNVSREMVFSNIKLTGLGITEPNKITDKVNIVVDEKPVTKDEKQKEIVKIIGELPPNTKFTIDEGNNVTINKYYDENGNPMNGIKKFKVVFEVIPMPKGNNEIMIPAVSATGGVIFILLVIGIIFAVTYKKKHKPKIDSVI